MKSMLWVIFTTDFRVKDDLSHSSLRKMHLLDLKLDSHIISERFAIIYTISAYSIYFCHASLSHCTYGSIILSVCRFLQYHNKNAVQIWIKYMWFWSTLCANRTFACYLKKNASFIFSLLFEKEKLNIWFQIMLSSGITVQWW